MEGDRNLLFGAFAVQLNIVSPADLIDMVQGEEGDSSYDLGQRLIDGGVLSERDRALVALLVEKAISAHDGDTVSTLETLNGADELLGNVPRPGAPCAGSKDVASTAKIERGRYSDITELARGGIGRVILVNDEELGRQIALKELLPSNADESSAQGSAKEARFLREARITGQLEHPSIVPVHELGYRPDGTPYYTMKLVRGRTLQTALQEADGLQGRLKLLPHVVDMCQAVAYAHSRGVVHRDIKPVNVMVGEFGETVLLDWGLAKVMGKEDILEEATENSAGRIQIGHAAELEWTAYSWARQCIWRRNRLGAKPAKLVTLRMFTRLAPCCIPS